MSGAWTYKTGWNGILATSACESPNSNVQCIRIYILNFHKFLLFFSVFFHGFQFHDPFFFVLKYLFLANEEYVYYQPRLFLQLLLFIVERRWLGLSRGGVYLQCNSMASYQPQMPRFISNISTHAIVIATGLVCCVSRADALCSWSQLQCCIIIVTCDWMADILSLSAFLLPAHNTTNVSKGNQRYRNKYSERDLFVRGGGWTLADLTFFLQII